MIVRLCCVSLDCVIYCAFYSILFRGRFFRTRCITVYRPTVAATVIFVDRFLRRAETTKHFTTVQTVQDYSLLWKWKKTFTSGEKTMLCLSFKLFYSKQNSPLLVLFAGTEPHVTLMLDCPTKTSFSLRMPSSHWTLLFLSQSTAQ